jgi:hypothetical protein
MVSEVRKMRHPRELRTRASIRDLGTLWGSRPFGGLRSGTGDVVDSLVEGDKAWATMRGFLILSILTTP